MTPPGADHALTPLRSSSATPSTKREVSTRGPILPKPNRIWLCEPWVPEGFVPAILGLFPPHGMTRELPPGRNPEGCFRWSFCRLLPQSHTTVVDKRPHRMFRPRISPPVFDEYSVDHSLIAALTGPIRSTHLSSCRDERRVDGSALLNRISSREKHKPWPSTPEDRPPSIRKGILRGASSPFYRLFLS